MRQWRDSDREPFRRMNADAAVMEFMPKRLTVEESDVLADCIQKRLEERGFGLFAAELRETGNFIGFVGLFGSSIRGSLHSMRRDRLAIGARVLGIGIRDRGRERSASIGLRVAGIVGSCVVHRSFERALTRSDGAAGNGTKHKG